MPALVVTDGPDAGSKFGFLPEGESLVFGTGAGADFVLSDPFLAREHFELLRRPGRLLVQAIGGETRVQDRRAKTELPLEPGAMIEAGSSLFVLAAKEPVFEEGPLTGRKLGGYELLERVGSGGMGEVYRARQSELDRVVAIKILADELTSDAAYIERFLREARAAGALNHPNVVEVHDVGEMEGVYYYSMEFIHGGAVLDLLRRKGKLCPADALKVVTEAARALEFAEKAGIVHCDIKPDNLMLTDTAQVRLADLGIAKRIGENIPHDPDEGVFGSPHYMSPEQAKGYEIDNRTDIYSLGATFYRILAGRPPFLGKDAREIMEKQAFEDPRPLAELDPSLPEVLTSIIEKMLRKERGERYASATELLLDLDRAKEQAPKRHEAALPSRRNIVAARRKRAFSSLGTAIAACAFLGGVLAGTVWPGERAEPPHLILQEIEGALAEGRLSDAEALMAEARAALPDGAERLEGAEAELLRRKAEEPERDALEEIVSSQEESGALIRSLREYAGACASSAVAAEAERLAAAAEAKREKRADKAFRRTLAGADLLACDLQFDRARGVLEEFIRSAPETLAAGRARLGLAELDPRRRAYVREESEDRAAPARAPEVSECRPEPAQEILRRAFVLARLYMFATAQRLLLSAEGGRGSVFESELEQLSRYRALKEALVDAIRRGALRDTSVEISGLKGWAASATADEVVLKLRGGKEARVDWMALPVQAFARLFLSGDARARDFETLARFCERSGLAKEAREALLRAHKKPVVRAAPLAEARMDELRLISELAERALAAGETVRADRLARAAELRFGPDAAAELRRRVENAKAREARAKAALAELDRLRRRVRSMLREKARASAELYAGLGEFITSGDVLVAAGEFAEARARYGESRGGLPGRAEAGLALAWALDIENPSAPERARELARRAIEADPERARRTALRALRLVARREALRSRIRRLAEERRNDVLNPALTEELVEFLRSALPLRRRLRVELEFLRSQFPDSPLVQDGTCDALILEHDWELRDHAAVLERLEEPRGELPFGRELLLWRAEGLFFAGDRAKAAELYRAYAAGEEDEFIRSGVLEKRLGACEGR